MDTTVPAREELWRAYLPEWLVAYSSTLSGDTGWEECYAFLRRNYDGKLHHHDFRFVTPDGQAPGADSGYSGWWVLQLRLNNLRGEFRDKDDAVKLAAELGSDAEVVAKFSREDRKLAGYGKRRLHGQ